MINFDDVSLGLSIAGFLVCLSDLLFTMMDKRFGKPQNKIYIFMIMLDSFLNLFLKLFLCFYYLDI